MNRSIHDALRSMAAGEDPLGRMRGALDRLPGSSRILAHRFEVAGRAGGELDGVGYLTKANIAVAGEPHDACSRILAGYRAPFEATVTRRLREAGATCLGSTNMDEFAMGSSGETSPWGAPEHPFLPGRVCGGSSSGSAAAVARGLVPFALGSDTGGSVRQPAGFCGLVGLKPTWGRVSRWGLIAHASSLDTIGVLATRVEDAARVLACIEGIDGLDSTLREWPGPPVPAPPGVVVVPRLRAGSTSAAVAENFRAVQARLRAGGWEVGEIELPSLDAALGAYVVLAAAEAASNLARFDGSLYGAREERDDFDATVRATRTLGFGPEVQLRVLLGTEVLRLGHTARALGRARAVVRRLREELDRALPRGAAMLLPTSPDPAFALGARIDDPVAMRQTDRFTVLASLLGLPAVAVPSGEDGEGAPLSVQCLAAPGREGLALGLAERIEELCEVRALQARWSSRIDGEGGA